MPVPDLFGILDAVKKLTAPAGMEAVHQDGFSWPRNGLTYGDSTKLTTDDWSRVIGNLRGLLVGSGVDLNTLDPASPMLLRTVLVNYIIAKLADVLPGYINDNSTTIAAGIIADPAFAGILGSALGALSFKFATATADADPGNGMFRLNAAPASATAAYLDNLDAYGVTVSGALDGWDDSTNTIRGTLTLGPVTNPAVHYTYNVTGTVVDGTGYRKLTLAYISGSGTIPAGAPCWLVFNRAGDKGDFAGPAVSIADNLVSFNGTTGKAGKDSGVKASDVAQGPASAVNSNLAGFNGTGGKSLKDSGVAAANVALLNASNTFTATQNVQLGAGQAIGVVGGAGGTAGFLINAPTGVGNAAFVSFNRSGAFAGNFGIDTDNKWKVGGWSMGAVAYEIVHMGNYTSLLDARYVGQAFSTLSAKPTTLAGYGIGDLNTSIAAMPVGGVGTYAFLGTNPGVDITTGSIVAGSGLRYTHAGGFVGAGAGTPSGSWMAMGLTVSGGGPGGASLFRRVS